MPGIDFSSGSLGHGLSIGVGMSEAIRLQGHDSRVIVLVGDGELDEGQLWEAAAYAAHRRLGSLLAIVDANGVSVDGKVEEVLSMEPIAAKWAAFGWHTENGDGHDLRALRKAYAAFDRRRHHPGAAPTVLVAKTVAGRGVSFIEGMRNGMSVLPRGGSRAGGAVDSSDARNRGGMNTSAKLPPGLQRHPNRSAQRGILRSRGTTSRTLLPVRDLRAQHAHCRSGDGRVRADPLRFHVRLLLGDLGLRVHPDRPRLPRASGAHNCNARRHRHGRFGSSHHAAEDISALRAVAGLTILSPPDASATEALLHATVDHPGPIYFRLSRGRDRDVYDHPPERYGPGAPRVVRDGSDVLLLGTGTTVGETLEAAKLLSSEQGIEATVLDVHTLKPFDVASVGSHASAHPVAVSVEEHNVEGGLGTLTRDAMIEAGVRTPMLRHGLPDEFALTGPPTHRYRYYGLDPVGIQTVVRRALDGDELWREADRQAVLEHYAGHQR